MFKAACCDIIGQVLIAQPNSPIPQMNSSTSHRQHTPPCRQNGRLLLLTQDQILLLARGNFQTLLVSLSPTGDSFCVAKAGESFEAEMLSEPHMLVARHTQLTELLTDDCLDMYPVATQRLVFVDLEGNIIRDISRVS